MSNFSFSHSVFKGLVVQTHEKRSLFGKWLIASVPLFTGQADTCGSCGEIGHKPVTSCKTCVKHLCENCAKQHAEDDILKEHELVSIPAPSLSSESEDSSLVCPNHEGNPLQVQYIVM